MIGIKEKISYGFGDMASSMFWKIFGMYMLYFYTDVFGLAPAAVGTMFLVTRIWDSVNDPIFGMIADRTRSRWGKFRPWILFGAVPFSVLGVLTFLIPPMSWTPAMRLLYAYVTYTSMMMVYSAVNVPYASLLGVTPSHLNRTVKAETGKSAGEWIDNARLALARELLCDRSMPMSEIAERLCFSEASYFSRFFRKMTGISPSAFREKMV